MLLALDVASYLLTMACRCAHKVALNKPCVGWFRMGAQGSCCQWPKHPDPLGGDTHHLCMHASTGGGGCFAADVLSPLHQPRGPCCFSRARSLTRTVGWAGTVLCASFCVALLPGYWAEGASLWSNGTIVGWGWGQGCHQNLAGTEEKIGPKLTGTRSTNAGDNVALNKAS